MPFAGQFGAAIQECFWNASLRVFPSNASLLEMTRREILHTAVGDAKLNHRLEFFRTAMALRIA